MAKRSNPRPVEQEAGHKKHRLSKQLGVAPNYLCVGPDNKLWEYINRPWEENGKERIGVRIPGDPMTYVEVFLEHYKPLNVASPDGQFYYADERNVDSHKLHKDIHNLKALLENKTRSRKT